MQTPRDLLTAKIKALLSKTLANGCTQAEAEAALTKAHMLMSQHELSLQDLNQIRTESATTTTLGKLDKLQIQYLLSTGIADFTHTKVWHNKLSGITYCGLKPDIELAQYLTTSLEHFVKAELFKYLLDNETTPGQKESQIITSFVHGCCKRLRQRLRELIPPATSQGNTTSTTNALTIIQHNAISQYLRDHNICLAHGRRQSITINSNAHAAGTSAANQATFHRPITSRTPQLTYRGQG